MAEDKKDRGGMGMRAKKFMGSRTAGTKLGRKAILNVLGDDGEILFNAIKASAKVYFGESKGKKLKENLLKMILKINLLVNEKQLTPENTAGGQEPVHALMFQAQRDFDGSGHHVDPEPLSKRLLEVSRIWVDIIKSKMQEKNVEKLQDVIKTLSDVKYLDKLFNSKECQDHRDAISASLARLMLAFGINDPNEPSNCQAGNCLNAVVRSRGLFRSAGFCATHHAEHFHFLCDKPVLQDFLMEERATSIFVDFLTAESDLAPYQFLKAVADFKSISSQNIRLRSVRAIKRKFLEEGAPIKVRVNSDAISAVVGKIDSLDEEEPRISTGLFGDVENEVRRDLSVVFDSKFVKSVYFERFVASYRLTTVDAKTATSA